MKKLFAGFSLALAFAFGVMPTAQARKYEMEVPGYEKVVMTNGEVPTAARVKAAILDGARKRRWEVVAVEPGKVTLRYAPRTHEAVVAVRYDDNGFKIEYVSSNNLDYQLKRGKAWIHGNYNIWLGNLSREIRLSPAFSPELAAPGQATAEAAQ